jgi:vitamin B12 transporter
MHLSPRGLTTLFVITGLHPIAGQTPVTHVLRGVVSSLQGAPVAGASVFVLESMDATPSGADGRFTLRTTAQGRVTVVARHIGFAPSNVVAPVDTAGDISLVLRPQAAVLVPITVQAGAYKAGNERGSTLTALEVVSTPGATADVARAMQTLPGVQNVDEGTGLFVRGGDVSETKVLLNNTVMLSPYNYETPTGNYTVTVNPFLLDGIFFSSGGFGARYGNILSGVADLRTAGRPVQSSVTAVAGLASVSTGADLALDHGVAIHATAARNDTELLFKLNGATRAYTPAPNGTDVSGSVIYNYRPTGELKAFAIDRHNAFGIGLDDPSMSGGYSSDVHSSMVQSGWSDVFGTVAPAVSVSRSTVHRNEGYGVFDLGNEETWSQLFTQTAWSPGDRYSFRIGGDVDWREARFVGSLDSTASSTGARIVKFDSRADGSRNGAFGELDWRALEELRVIAGLRTDYSSFTRVRTADPRLSLAYRIGGDATLTAAAGEYHQVSDPLYFASGIGSPGLSPMASRQYVLGWQLGESKQIARVELYDKRYRDLVGLTHDKVVVGGGTGEARGADVFLKHSIGPYLSARVTYSYVDSKRTDPSAGTMAPAAFDITNSVAVIADQQLPKGWSVSGAFRHATGKPYTPIIGAAFDAADSVWNPRYGAPNSERLPAAQRLDLAMSRVTRLGPRTILVYFVSVDNVLDRVNLYQYAYNADYTQRIPVRSLFKRSLYFGASLTHLELGR